MLSTRSWATVVSAWQVTGLQKASIVWSRRHPYLDEGFYHLPKFGNRCCYLCFPSPSLVRPDEIQVADHPSARQTPGHAWLPLEYDFAFRKDAAATGASDCSRMNFRLCFPPPSTSLPSPPTHPHQWQLTGETTPAPNNVSHGTEVGAYGLLGTPASATSAAPVTETIRGYAARFFPLPPIAFVPSPLPQGGGTKGV